MKFPTLSWIICLEHHRLMGIVISHKESPESTLVITQGGSPLTTTIDCTISQVITGSVFDLVEEIRDCFPMHKVSTAHDGSTREKVHGSGDQIVVVTHTNDVWVRCICPDERVLHLNLRLSGDQGQLILSAWLCRSRECHHTTQHC